MTLIVPPVTERREDIPLLCQHFLRKFARSQEKELVGLDDAVLKILMDYEFPGNIRELENIMERAAALARGPLVRVDDLPPDMQQRRLFVTGQRPREFLTLEENEREYIAWILKQVNYNKTRAAEILGIDRVSLWRKLRRLQMDD
jgi:DNA-binding NtrC family response regulator